MFNIGPMGRKDGIARMKTGLARVLRHLGNVNRCMQAIAFINDLP